MKTRRLHLVIKGRVQGVFYRASTRETALSLGLTGWVRNLPDGNVEAVFEGAEDHLVQALTWCTQGPPGAAVTGIDEEWHAFKGEFSTFDVRYH
ncbi:MAG: acylphosphatase [Nitrospiraceae bacterium]|nr:MAG: acylphosphatase [Nitrospiraceae bacterium]